MIILLLYSSPLLCKFLGEEMLSLYIVGDAFIVFAKKSQ